MTANERLVLVMSVRHLGVQVRAVAARLGIHPSHLTRVRRGHEPLSAKLAEGMEREYDVSAMWLRFGTGSMMVTHGQPLGVLDMKGGVRRTGLGGRVAEPFPIVRFACGQCRAVLPDGRAANCPICGITVAWPEPLEC